MGIDRSRLAGQLTADRRAIHAHAESAFTEFWTASRIALSLKETGWDVLVGKEIMSEEHRMGVPAKSILDSCYNRALSEGADPALLARMEGGFTAVAGVMKNGEGPVNAFRFDIDAVDVDESTSAEHAPVREGFASMHGGAMHACGHDAHASIGLALARLLAEDRGAWSGTVKLVFQPAEEGVRGARSIAESGFLDDVDNMVAGHIGIIPQGSGNFYCGVGGFLSTTKLDMHFTGKSAHAGVNPELGRNAVLAAASAALHINGIPRHSAGATRVNIGKISGGSGRNVIPEKAFLALETRGETSELNQYMAAEAIRMAESIGAAFGVGVRVERMGEAVGAESDPGLMAAAAKAARKAGYERIIETPLPLGGSEDFSFMMDRVARHGGKALYVVFGTNLKDAHHAPLFDISEQDLPTAAITFLNLAGMLSKK